MAVLIGFLIGCVVWLASEIRGARKAALLKAHVIAAEQQRKEAQRESYEAKKNRQHAQKAAVHFEAAAEEPEPVVVHMAGEDWSEVWMGDTVAFQNVKTGEIVQDGAEFNKLTHGK
jgi:transcription elongation GreA/GreB family factor